MRSVCIATIMMRIARVSTNIVKGVEDVLASPVWF